MSRDDLIRSKGWIERALAYARDRLFGKMTSFFSSRKMYAELEKWDPDRPLISVVIPCYNHGHTLGEAVDSVLASTWQDLEVLVVDDGSDDPRTRTVLDGFSRPKTEVLLHPQNEGLPAARNTGIRHAQGKYICCLDADDKLHPTYLEKALFLLETNQGVDLVYAWTQVFGDEERVWHAPQFDPAELIHYNQLNPPGVFRRAAWEEVGGFREEMRWGYEDWEFWIRLARAGCWGHRIPEKLIYVRREGRSFLDEAAERHKELVADIRRYNPDVYEDDSWLDQAARATKNIYVHQPLLNLSDRGSYVSLQDPILWIHHRHPKEFKFVIEDLRHASCQRGCDLLIVSTHSVEEEIQDMLYEETDYVYVLPHFLPRYAWDAFLGLLREVRGAEVMELNGGRF